MLENIKRVTEVRGAERANEYIELGWTVREICKVVTDDVYGDSYARYVLTWERDSEPAMPPEKYAEYNR